MENQNITISVPKPLLKKAKVLAAGMDKSLSELFRETLEQRVREMDGYNKAKNRQLRLLRKGLSLGTGGKISVKRGELYER